MTYLITGIQGFVGRHLSVLLGSDAGSRLVGLVPNRSESDGIGLDPAVEELVESSMDSVDGLRAVLDDVQPDRIIHLAAQSSVGESWRQPAETFFNNSNIFLNLLEAMRLSGSGSSCRLLSVGSSEQYGNSLPRSTGYSEDDPQAPTSPYAVARVAQEQLARVYVEGYGLDIVLTRSFNHIGPGQSDRFVVSALARQCVEVASGARDEISCGNLEVVRDFIDVRDVCRAYRVLLEKGRAGEVYNVCSGSGVELASILTRLTDVLDIDPVVRTDPALIRPIDNPVVVGDPAKLRALDWTAEHPLHDTLCDVVDGWRGKASRKLKG